MVWRFCFGLPFIVGVAYRRGTRQSTASSYSTLGCSDVTLPSNWRTLAPVESIIGVLMCGISVSLLFAIVTRLINHDPPQLPPGQRRKTNNSVFAQAADGAYEANKNQQTHISYS